MNFLYHDIIHALQNTIDLCINSASARDGRGYVLERRFTKFSEIKQLFKAGSFKVTDFGTNRNSEAHIRLPISD